jgi:hypothetical protein
MKHSWVVLFVLVLCSCGANVQKSQPTQSSPPPVSSNVIAGNTSNIVLLPTMDSNPLDSDSEGLGVNNTCIPLDGSITLPANESVENLSINGYGCAYGGSGTLSKDLSGNMLVKISSLPSLPNDGSALQVGIYNQRLMQGYGAISWGCTPRDPATSYCVWVVDMTGWNKGDYVGIMYAYFPGTNFPTSFTLGNVSWTVNSTD